MNFKIRAYFSSFGTQLVMRMPHAAFTKWRAMMVMGDRRDRIILRWFILVFSSLILRNDDVEMNREFLIVEFPDEKRGDDSTPMAIISKSWTFYNTNGYLSCYWPDYIKREDQRVLALREDFDLEHDKCSIWRINVKYKTPTYEKAVEKLSHLECYSNVSQSEAEEFCAESQEHSTKNSTSNKRTQKMNKRLEDYCLSSSDEAPNPPSIKHFYRNIEEKSITPRLKPKIRVSTENSTNRVRVENSTRFSAENTTRSPLTENNTIAADAECNIPSSRASSGINPYSSRPVQACNLHDYLLQDMMKKLEHITQKMEYMCTLLKIENKNMEIEGNEIENLPAHSEEELTQVNEYLTDLEYFSKLSSILQLVGGKDLVDNTRRILTKIISNDLAKHCNWLGRNGKIGFEKYRNIIKLILVTVRKNPLCKDATENEINAVIKQWCRTAADREGGRSRRRNNQ